MSTLYSMLHNNFIFCLNSFGELSLFHFTSCGTEGSRSISVALKELIQFTLRS